MIRNILNRVYFENTVLDYFIALGIFIIALIAVKIFSIIILKRLKIWSERTETNFDDFVISQVEKSAIPILYIASIFPAKNYLTVKPSVDLILNGILITIITFYAIRTLIAFLNYSIQVYSTRRDPAGVASMKGISTFISIFVWGLGLVFLLDNLGFEVSAVIAGLGIGGIAIALAAQAVLGDLFSYFVIFFDKPFQIGDFIIVDNKMGTIEKIGIKTTRVRSLSGEEIIFPNNDLTGSRVHNYKKMEKRRIEYKFGVAYQTEYAKVKEIPDIVKAIITSMSDVVLDRVHLKEFGAYSLNYEVIFIMQTADYNKYMDTQQEINFRLHQEFEKRGIQFAYPTQTLYVHNENPNQNGDGQEQQENKNIVEKK